MDLLWLRVAAVFYAAASIAVFPAVLHEVERWRKICVHLTGLAFFFHFVANVEMLIQVHHWMPVGVREVESLLGFVVAGLFLLVWWLYDGISLGLFALPATFFLMLAPMLGPGGYVFPSQGVKVSWVIAHLVALFLSYTALLFSLLASTLYLIQERRLKGKRGQGQNFWWDVLDWLPALDTLERMALATLEFGFPCMTVGLAIGAVLVQDGSLGASYYADPKIIASFVSWVVYVVLVIIRRSAGLRGRKAAYLTGAVFVVVIAVWAANLFSHVHKYGAP